MQGGDNLMKRVLVATDGSDGASRAVDAAAELAKVTGSELVIATIGGEITGAELRRLAGTGGDLSKTLETKADRVLRRAARRARRIGVAAPILRCGWGDPADTILEIVQREKVGVIVVGRRGRSRLSQMLLGSVSQKVASLAPCTVVMVP
jgi:nucleotide-binding universal stress UspA family protein